MKCYDVKRDVAREYDDESPTLIARIGTGGESSSYNRRIYGFKPNAGSKARGIGWEYETSPTLDTGCSSSIGIVEITNVNE